MENLRIFFDHLLFAVVSVFVVMLVFSLVLGSLVSDFSLGDHLWLAAIVWIVSSVGLAGGLTYSSVRNKSPDRVEFTRRRY